jgi:hypothetical protein
MKAKIQIPISELRKDPEIANLYNALSNCFTILEMETHDIFDGTKNSKVGGKISKPEIELDIQFTSEEFDGTIEPTTFTLIGHVTEMKFKP